MTITQLEERLSVLEQTVARLQKQVEHRQSSSDLPQTEDDIIEGAAYDLTPELIPKVTYHVRAKIVKIEKVTLGLGCLRKNGLPYLWIWRKTMTNEIFHR